MRNDPSLVSGMIVSASFDAALLCNPAAQRRIKCIQPKPSDVITGKQWIHIDREAHLSDQFKSTWWFGCSHKHRGIKVSTHAPWTSEANICEEYKAGHRRYHALLENLVT